LIKWLKKHENTLSLFKKKNSTKHIFYYLSLMIKNNILSRVDYV